MQPGSPPEPISTGIWKQSSSIPSTIRPKLTSMWRRSCSSSSAVGRFLLTHQRPAPAAASTKADTETICHSRTEIWIMAATGMRAELEAVPGTPPTPRISQTEAAGQSPDGCLRAVQGRRLEAWHRRNRLIPRVSCWRIGGNSVERSRTSALTGVVLRADKFSAAPVDEPPGRENRWPRFRCRKCLKGVWMNSGVKTRMKQVNSGLSLMFSSMMNTKTLAMVVLLFGAANAEILRSQAPAPSPATTSVVTVSFNAAVLQTAEAQREMASLQSKYAPRQAQLKALSDEIAELQKQLEATDDKLSDAERASREQTLSTKGKQFQRQSDDFKSDSQSDSQQVFQTVAQKVFAFLKTYAQQHGHSVVIERGSDAAPVVWYVAGNLDITDALVKAYNAQSGATAPTPSNKPGAANANPSSSPKPQPSGAAPK